MEILGEAQGQWRGQSVPCLFSINLVFSNERTNLRGYHEKSGDGGVLLAPLIPMSTPMPVPVHGPGQVCIMTMDTVHDFIIPLHFSGTRDMPGEGREWMPSSLPYCKGANAENQMVRQCPLHSKSKRSPICYSARP